MFRNPGARGAAHVKSALWIAEKLDHCFEDGLGIAGRNEKAGDFSDDGIAGASGLRGDDGNACGLGLQNSIGKAFAPGGKNHHIHAAVVRGSIVDETGAMNARMVENATAQSGVERVFGAVKPAHEQQMSRRLQQQNPIEGFNQLRQALVAREAADEAHDRSVA